MISRLRWYAVVQQCTCSITTRLRRKMELRKNSFPKITIIYIKSYNFFYLFCINRLYYYKIKVP